MIEVTLRLIKSDSSGKGWKDYNTSLAMLDEAFTGSCDGNFISGQDRRNFLNGERIRFRITFEQFARFIILRRDKDVYNRVGWSDGKICEGLGRIIDLRDKRR